MEKRLGEKRFAQGFQEHFPFGYDSLWAAALVLNQTMNVIAPKKLSDIQYKDEETAEIMRKFMHNTSFFGVTVCEFFLRSVSITN